MVRVPWLARTGAMVSTQSPALAFRQSKIAFSGGDGTAVLPTANLPKSGWNMMPQIGLWRMLRTLRRRLTSIDIQASESGRDTIEGYRIMRQLFIDKYLVVPREHQLRRLQDCRLHGP